MADLARIKRNVAKMAAQNAPIEDIDGYITSEGVTIDDVRSFRPGADAEQAKAPPPAVSPPDAAKQARDNYYSSGIYAGDYNPLGTIAKSLGAASDAVGSGLLMGWDDEANAALATGGGTLGDYEAKRQEFDAMKAARREQNPVASVIGELAGGVAGGGTLASAGLTTAGRAIPVIGRAGGAAIEGAAYGAASGAGEASPGGRLRGAGEGALVGAATGAAMSKAGDWLASRSAQRVANEAAPTSEELATQSQALYDRAYQAGVSLEQKAADRLIDNMRFAGGRVNANLRPRTAGMIEDLNAMRGQPMDLQRFHELRQEIDVALRRADPPDELPLTRMRDLMNSFADKATSQQVSGPAHAFDDFRAADDLWKRRTKTKTIEELFDLADVKSGRYSQSGMENAIRDKASQLYTRIAKKQERGFTGEEMALIRQLARGNSSPALVKWVAKFAPRGVVSAGVGTGLGASIGTTIGGPVGGAIGFAVPGAIGHVAGRTVDNAAQRMLQSVQTAAATGNAPVLNAITNKTVPFIGGAASEVGSLPSRIRR